MDVQTDRQQPGGSLMRIQVYRAEWESPPLGSGSLSLKSSLVEVKRPPPFSWILAPGKSITGLEIDSRVLGMGLAVFL